MPENLNEELAPDGLGYGQILSVLWRQRLWIIGAICITVPIAAYNSLQKDPAFRSSMQLLVESNYRERDEVARVRAEQVRFAEGAPPEIDYATQLRVMRSSSLLERAANRLQADYPDITAGEIQGKLAVLRVTETEDEIETSILQVDYSDSDPDKTKKVLEAMRTVYLEYNLEQQQLRLESGLSFINEQLPTVQQELEDAEKSLERFREEKSLIDPEQQATDLTEALAAIEADRRDLQAELNDLQAQYGNLQEQLARSPRSALVASRLSESERYQNLLNAYQEVEIALADLRVTYTEQAPNVKVLRQQLEQQRALLQQEIGRVLGGQSAALSGDVLSEGQLGDIDLALANDLVQAQTQLSGLAARDGRLATVERQLRQNLTRFPELIAEYNRLQPEIEIQRDTLQQLLRARQDLSIDIARGGFNWQVVEDPQLGSRTGPNFKVDVMLGGIAGLFLGVVLAFIREGLDDKIHSATQLRDLASVPQLGSLPWSQHSFSPSILERLPLLSLLPGFKRQSPQVYDAPSLQMVRALQGVVFRDPLDLIYKNLQLLNPNQTSTSIAVTSAVAEEGKSTLALGLAITAARLHQKVLLIDANLRHPTLHHVLNLSDDAGLTTLLTAADPGLCSYRLSFPDYSFDVLPAGPIPPDPVRLLSSQAMQDQIQAFEKTYDWIILDTPPVIGTADALQTASACRHTLLVARLNQLSKAELTTSFSLLSRFNLIGMVINGDQTLSVDAASSGDFQESLMPTAIQAERVAPAARLNSSLNA